MPHKDPERRRVYDNQRHKAKYAANIEQSRANSRERQRARRAANQQADAYLTQKSHAKQRNILFLLTFEEWWAIWEASGKFEQRGRRRDQYVMARTGDIGPYAVGNIRICTNKENASEYALNISPETRARMSEAGKRREHTDETRARMSAAQLKRYQETPRSAETRMKISDGKRGKPLTMEHRMLLSAIRKGRKGRSPSAETRQKLSIAALAREAKKRAHKSGFQNS